MAGFKSLVPFFAVFFSVFALCLRHVPDIFEEVILLCSKRVLKDKEDEVMEIVGSLLLILAILAIL